MNKNSGDTIQSLTLGGGLGKSGVYQVSEMDKVFHAVAEGEVTVTMKGGQVFTGTVGKFVGYSILNDTATISCTTGFNIG